TGIGRFLEGLLLAIAGTHPDWRLHVAMSKQCALPSSLQGKVQILYLPHASELFWPGLAREHDIFISPYPKLPWHPLSCPAIHTVHDVLYLEHPAYRGNRLRIAAARVRLRRALKQADLTWFDSDISREACTRLVGRPRDARIRYPAVEEMFSPGEPVWARDEPYFLYVGNGLPHKNLPAILRAIEHVPAFLLCAGVRDAMADKMKTRFPEAMEKTRLLSHVPDEELVRLYRGATALLLPSTTEGYGYPPLEAMACGTPAIVADIPVLRETMCEQATYCSPHAVEDWVGAMRQMMDPEHRRKRSRQGLEWIGARQGHDGWQAHIRDIEQLLERG
ncbi:MAG: glycosyltransferase family 1 protein, partial [Mariprofundaceae bacterium]|nr:glycosyltransferase family 1 protein [Mariprofundaceae bacterium]